MFIKIFVFLLVEILIKSKSDIWIQRCLEIVGSSGQQISFLSSVHLPFVLDKYHFYVKIIQVSSGYVTKQVFFDATLVEGICPNSKFVIPRSFDKNVGDYKLSIGVFYGHKLFELDTFIAYFSTVKLNSNTILEGLAQKYSFPLTFSIDEIDFGSYSPRSIEWRTVLPRSLKFDKSYCLQLFNLGDDKIFRISDLSLVEAFLDYYVVKINVIESSATFEFPDSKRYFAKSFLCDKDTPSSLQITTFPSVKNIEISIRDEITEKDLRAFYSILNNKIVWNSHDSNFQIIGIKYKIIPFVTKITHISLSRMYTCSIWLGVTSTEKLICSYLDEFSYILSFYYNRHLIRYKGYFGDHSLEKEGIIKMRRGTPKEEEKCYIHYNNDLK